MRIDKRLKIGVFFIKLCAFQRQTDTSYGLAAESNSEFVPRKLVLIGSPAGVSEELVGDKREE